MEVDKSTVWTEEEANMLTPEDVVAYQAEYEKRAKAHKKWQLAFGITGLVLLGLGLAVATPLVAAWGPAWWALNGPLTGFGILGLGAFGVTRFLDRKNRANLKVMNHVMKNKGLDQRSAEENSVGLVNDFEKNKKKLSPIVVKFHQKTHPTVNEEKDNLDGPTR